MFLQRPKAMVQNCLFFECNDCCNSAQPVYTYPNVSSAKSCYVISFFQCIATAASAVGALLSLLVLSETSTKGNNMVMPYMDDSFNVKAVFGLTHYNVNAYNNAYNKQCLQYK